MPARPHDAAPQGRSRRARRVVWAVLVVNQLWVLLIPWAQTDRSSAVRQIALGAGLVATAVAIAVLMRAAVGLGDGPRAPRPHGYRWPAAAALAAVLALWWPAAAWAEPGRSPWAWAAGLVAGALALALPPRPAAAAGLGLAAAAVAGGLVQQVPVWRPVLALVGSGASVVVMLYGLLWLLRLLESAERAAGAEAELAVLRERLRISRELHDALGHRLTVMALRAELAGRLAATDPAAAHRESEAVRELASTALAEVRRTLRDESGADLPSRIDSARLVLESAGVGFDVALAPEPLTADESRLLAAVLREAVTNVLRHARARRVTVRLTSAPRVFTVANDTDPDTEPDPGTDRVPTPRTGTAAHPDPTPGTGLAGLAARCADLGAVLAAGPTSGPGFELRVVLAARGPGQRSLP